uniref:Cytochrome c oxidase subunit 3 n=1 Tax=Pleuropoma jana TaxID=1882665 RepID=A0A1B2G3B5_9GAST|nr:cytochrome c oxidase subunit III [Pleuropoma jana]
MIRSPFHLVGESPWPILASGGALFLVIGLISWFYGMDYALLMYGIGFLFVISFLWWRDVVRESTFQGYHTFKVVTGLRLGMILFIISEVCFFFAFFWAFYHSMLSPNIEVGSVWPPIGVNVINPFSVPLLNTSVLLTSGISITWAHHSLLIGDRYGILYSLFITIILGVYFTVLQLDEYVEASFGINDNVYGSTFFVSTGFHGLHVMIGTTFLVICLLRVFNCHFSKFHHFGFEAAAWYWHFVDVVWLLLYLSIYWLGS